MRALSGTSHLLISLLLAARLSLSIDPSLEPRQHQLHKRLDDDVSLHELYKKSPKLDEITGTTTRRKQEQGTKDAPVDGKDGKPHAGPFVDALDSDEPLKTAMDKSTNRKDKSSPEEGVMNDPSHAPPQKGTTGTEGGVSEKSKSKESQENETGRRKKQKPVAPKDADAVTHKEDDLSSDATKSSKDSTKLSSKQNAKDDKADGASSVEASKKIL